VAAVEVEDAKACEELPEDAETLGVPGFCKDNLLSV